MLKRPYRSIKVELPFCEKVCLLKLGKGFQCDTSRQINHSMERFCQSRKRVFQNITGVMFHRRRQIAPCARKYFY